METDGADGAQRTVCGAPLLAVSKLWFYLSRLVKETSPFVRLSDEVSSPFCSALRSAIEKDKCIVVLWTFFFEILS